MDGGMQKSSQTVQKVQKLAVWKYIERQNSPRESSQCRGALLRAVGSAAPRRSRAGLQPHAAAHRAAHAGLTERPWAAAGGGAGWRPVPQRMEVLSVLAPAAGLR